MDPKKLRLLFSVLIVALVAVVIFQNYQPITVQILMASITMPLAILLLLVLITGLTGGWLFRLVSSSGKRSRK